MKYIELRNQARKWSVVALCRVLQVSESGYYKYLRNKSKPYKYADLIKQIYDLLKEDPENANYGVKRIAWIFATMSTSLHMIHCIISIFNSGLIKHSFTCYSLHGCTSSK